MPEYVNGTTDILGGSVIRYALNTTTPNQAVIRKIIAGNGITITSTGVDPGTGDVTISVDLTGTGTGGGSTGGGQTGGGGTGGGGTSGGSSGVGTVTSVNMTTPVGLTVLGAPITSAGTLALRLSSGYSIPLTEDVNKGVEAYNKRIVGVTFNTTNGVLTLSQADGGGLITTISNIYTTSGTLTGNRIVNSGGFNLTFTGTNSALSGVARGLNLTHSLVAGANNDVLVGLDVTPTFTNGGFTGLTNLAARLNGMVQINSGLSNNSSGYALEITGTGGTMFYIRGFGDAYLTGSTPVLYVGNGGTFLSSGSAYLYSNQASNNPFLTVRHNNTTEAIVVYSNGKITLQENATGNVIIGSATDTGLYKVDVAGSMRIGTNLNAVQLTVVGATTTAGVFTSEPVSFNGTNRIIYSNGLIFSSNNNLANSTKTYWEFTSQVPVADSGAGGIVDLVKLNMPVNNGTQAADSRALVIDFAVTTNVGVLTAIDAVSGKIRLRDLAGTGSRMVVADANGILSTQAIPSGGGGSGTVTSVSVVSANGFAGSVATSTTTPEITLSTSVTGLVKGNGTALSAAVAGTDYQAPITLTTTGNSGAATFSSNTLNIPNYTLAGLGGVSSNIYTADGTLTSDRTLTHGGFHLTLVGGTHTNRFTAAGRLLLGTTTESVFLLDTLGLSRFQNTLTYSVAANAYAALANANLTFNAGASISSGSFLGSLYSFGLNTFNGSVTVPNSVVMSSQFLAQRIKLNSAGMTLTMSQGSVGIRTVAGQIQQVSFDDTSTAGTVTHLAGIQFLAPYKFSGTQVNVTNYYGIVLNPSDEYSSQISIANRWGLYQKGSADRNYFEGNVIIGSNNTNAGAYPLQVTGQVRFNSYTSTSAYAGTAAGYVAFDSSGNLITVSAGSSLSLTTTGNSGPATLVGSTLNIPVYTNITDGLVSGGLVTWSGTGFIYDVSAAYYYINGVYYTTANTQVTLGAADVSNPRLDIVAVNSSGQVVVIPGVPGSNPVKAQIDPTTQIELTTILVPAGATSPVNITTAILYDEVVNSTWTSSATGVTVDFANTTTPYTGSVTASVSASTTGTRFIDFTRSSGTDSTTNYAVLKFAIRLGSAWTSTSTLAIGFYNNNTLISTEVSVLNGQFGFNMATTATYQLIQIPIANFRFTQATFTRVRFRFLNSLPAFRLDRVELQAGVVQTLVQSNNIYTSDGSLAGIRTLTLNGNYLDIVGSGASTRFNANGSVNIGGTITATTLASGSDKIVVANATGAMSTATVGSGLSLSGGTLSATGGAAGTVTASPGGTAGFLAKFSSATNIVDSIVSESGSVLSIAGSVSATSTLTSTGFIKTGGTSAQFLKADGSVDSAVYTSSASFATDYDNTITGLKNSSNKVFTTSQNFVTGSTRVFVNGVRMSNGGSYDYTETASNQITFTNAPDNGDLIVIDYIKS